MGRAFSFVFVALTALGSATLISSPFARLPVALSGVTALICLHKALGRKALSQTHGSAGFASWKEIRDLLAPLEKPLAPGEILLGKKYDQALVLSREQALRHGLIVGGSGTGKSFGFFLPNAALSHGTSCVFTDPKSELWRYTSGLHSSLRFAPGELCSESFNWIPLCRDARMAELCARAIIESGNTQYTEQVWLDLEAAYLAALFSHASTLPVPTPLTAYRLFTCQKQKTLLKQLLSSSSPVAREQATIFEQAHDKMRGSIVPVVAARLQFMRDPLVAQFTSATMDAPDFTRLRKEPLAVYWCLKENDIARLRPLTSVFFTVLLEQLGQCAEEQSQTVPVNLFLDEFGAIGNIPDFETIIALARGRQLAIWLGIQSLSQLESRYGKSAAQTIITNCASKLALSGLDVETGEYFSRTLGQETVVVTRRSWQRSRFGLLAHSIGDIRQEHPRALMTAEEVRRLPQEQALGIIGNRRPMLFSKLFYQAPPQTAQVSGLGPACTLTIEEETTEVTRKEEPPAFPEGLL